VEGRRARAHVFTLFVSHVDHHDIGDAFDFDVRIDDTIDCPRLTLGRLQADHTRGREGGARRQGGLGGGEGRREGDGR